MNDLGPDTENPRNYILPRNTILGNSGGRNRAGVIIPGSGLVFASAGAFLVLREVQVPNLI